MKMTTASQVNGHDNHEPLESGRIVFLQSRTQEELQVLVSESFGLARANAMATRLRYGILILMDNSQLF